MALELNAKFLDSVWVKDDGGGLSEIDVSDVDGVIQAPPRSKIFRNKP